MAVSKLILSLIVLATLTQPVLAGPVSGFVQTSLVSDGAVPADHIDPDLQNPWGIAFGPTTPFWIADNATGLSTLYNGSGTKLGLVVNVTGDGGATGTPTGVVFNGNSSVFNGARFIFANEDGSIAGWSSSTTAQTLFSNPGGAVYKGIAIGATSGHTYLYVANFAQGTVDIYPSTGSPPLPGSFTDPTIPTGFAPFNVQNISGQIYVTYAMQDAALHDDVPGAGNGFVSVFKLDGTFVGRLISQGPLNSPWGMAVAPSGFGELGGDLLVGNFGDGAINVFTPGGVFVGALSDVNGDPLPNDGLWGLSFGNGAQGFDTKSLYLTAGINQEADGLFARIDFNPAPEPATVGLYGLGIALLGWRAACRRYSTFE